MLVQNLGSRQMPLGGIGEPGRLHGKQQAEVRAEREVWLGLEAGSKQRTGFQTQRS